PIEDSFIIEIFPNPFNMETTISFLLEEKAFISIDIYNIHGKLLNRIENSFYDTGNYSLTWNGTDETGRRMPAGIYVFRFNVGSNSYNRRVVLN
ncbi:MAG: T9SS type A sorting domain-containing protein, partial [Bacteroidales bacterium]|nr:T9SS type A sorting domain-containing protein [Bacteroidales bacterium]